jgi:2'-5' RNA ligase
VSQSAVLVHVPEAEPVVGGWRRRYTHDAPLGIPPHVTLLFPFVAAGSLDEEVERRLANLLSEAEPFAVTFARTARFPTILYLEPQPSAPFSALTEAIAADWPEHPPYEGEFDEVIPHLTVAESDDERLIAQIEADVVPQLPVRSRVREAQLYVEDAAGRWHEHRRLPLAQ